MQHQERGSPLIRYVNAVVVPTLLCATLYFTVVVVDTWLRHTLGRKRQRHRHRQHWIQLRQTQQSKHNSHDSYLAETAVAKAICFKAIYQIHSHLVCPQWSLTLISCFCNCNWSDKQTVVMNHRKPKNKSVHIFSSCFYAELNFLSFSVVDTHQTNTFNNCNFCFDAGKWQLFAV